MAADTSAERVGLLMDALMRVLVDHPDGIRAKDAIESTAARVELSEYEQGTYADGSPRFMKIVRFATIDLKRAGWIIKQRGYWQITPDGVAALTQYSDPVDRYKVARTLYNEWRRQNPPAEGPPDSAIDVPEQDDLGAALETAEADAWDQISAYLAAIDPYDLQDLTAALLEGMGYFVNWSAPPGRDGGLDVIAFTDPLGTTGPRIKVQVKRWDRKVDVDGLRSFMSLLGSNDVGLFFSTGGFTKDAEDHARQQESRRITLLDSDRFFRLWIQHYDQVPEAKRSLLPIRPIYFLDDALLD